MALARACLSNALRSRRSFPLLHNGGAARLRGLAVVPSFPYSSSGDAAADSSREDRSDQVAVTRAPSPARGRRSRRLSWRNPWDLSPFHLNDGFGNALLQVSENLNGLLERLSPSRLLGRLKEEDKCYKLRYEVPGLRKEDLRVTVEEGMLVITGESEDEDAGDESSSSTTEDEGDGGWHTRRYGYINATLLLPEDAKADEIRAELRDGILRIYIPRSEEKKSNAREIEIN